MQTSDIFVIFNTTSIGDVLVTNTLVQNIKFYYPDSFVVFVCNSPIYDVAKYQDGVDEVITYDKKNCKSLIKIFEFARKFPYKKPFASFVTYTNERNLLISRLIGAKHIISHHKFRLWNTKENFKLNDYDHMKDKWGGLIEPLSGEHKNLPIKYIPPVIKTPIIDEIQAIKNPVPISPTSNYYKKDMGVNDCAELINLLNNQGYTPVIVGAGNIAKEFVNKLKDTNISNFIDIVDKTSIIELANILKICGCCISVDTGTLHMSNALNVPVVGIFYDGHAGMWGSDTTLYPAKILEGAEISPLEAVNAFNELIGVCV